MLSFENRTDLSIHNPWIGARSLLHFPTSLLIIVHCNASNTYNRDKRHRNDQNPNNVTATKKKSHIKIFLLTKCFLNNPNGTIFERTS